MRIAMLGAKGIPATWGGVERHVEDLAVRFVDQGHEVTVYCRPYYTTTTEPIYKGVKLRKVYTPGTRSLDAIGHTFLSSLDIIKHRKDFDLVHYHAIGPATCSFLTRWAGLPTIATVHGLDWQREKWGALATAYLKFGEKASCKFPNQTIAVSKSLKSYLQDKYHRPITYIPNGISPAVPQPAALLDKFGLEAGKYLLFVGRLVPEKGCHTLLEAFQKIDPDLKLVFAGGSSHSDHYEDQLKAQASDKIIFTGYVFGADLQALYTHAYAYIQPSTVEGLPFTLLEAMTYGQVVLASDIEPCKEVIGEGGLLFQAGSADDLAAKISLLASDPDKVEGLRDLAKQQDLSEYSYDSIALETLELYKSVLEGVNEISA